MDFLLRYTCRTQYSLSGAPGKLQEIKDYLEIEIPDGKILVRDYYEEIDSEDLHQGLRFDVVLQEIDEDYARKWVNRMRHIISYIAKTEISKPRLKYSMRKEDSVNFSQKVMLDEPFVSKNSQRKFDVNLFYELNEELNELFVSDSEDDEELFDEVNRAIKYYSKSLEQETPVDRFTMLYMALDALKQELKQEYLDIDLRDYEEEEPDRSEGIYGLIRFFREFSELEFKSTIYHARCNIFHDADTSSLESEYIEVLEEAVQRAILRQLGISYSDYSNTLEEDSQKIDFDIALRINGEIGNAEIPDLALDLKVPKVDISEVERVFEWELDKSQAQERGEFRGFLKIEGELLEDTQQLESYFQTVDDETLENLEISKLYRNF